MVTLNGSCPLYGHGIGAGCIKKKTGLGGGNLGPYANYQTADFNQQSF